MLIVPMHRAPTRETFPWMTLALILVNVLVFALFQSTDARSQRRAVETYVERDLAHWEAPAFAAWLRDHDGGDVGAARAAERADPSRLALLIQDQPRFLAALHAGLAIAPDSTGYAEWQAGRAAFEGLWDDVFTRRWMLRFSRFEPQRIVAAMFLHGDFGHLFGNLVFLAVLGLLVEGALGPRLFLVVYLLGGFASAALSLAWRWGDEGTALGASGAIASLMGAYCVLWGARKVRFFWWFFIAFDYVEAPALVLLPFWLGWELLNLVGDRAARVGFDAHAGGIVAGALLAVGVRRLGWERRDFLDADLHAESAALDRAALASAIERIDRLDTGKARALLEPIATRRPDDLDVAVALYRCACNEPRQPRLDEAAVHVLGLDVTGSADVREQKRVFDDYRDRASGAALAGATPLALARRWPGIGEASAAASLLAELVATAPATPGLAATCLAVARDAAARGATVAAKTLLDLVVANFVGTPSADKARLLRTDFA